MEQADDPGLWPEPNTVEVRLRRILTGLSVGICQAYDLLAKIFYPLFMTLSRESEDRDTYGSPCLQLPTFAGLVLWAKLTVSSGSDFRDPQLGMLWIPEILEREVCFNEEAVTLPVPRQNASESWPLQPELRCLAAQ